MKKLLLILALGICVQGGKLREREGKLLSLFNVLTFENDACTAVSDRTMSGTCYTSTECQSKGGTSDGNCAAGFGVCCVFTKSTCGGTVNQNCTYLQNVGYPSGSNTLQTCTYTFSRICDDLCQVRLDFDRLVTDQPDALTGACTNDKVTASSPSAANPPVICGTMTGQHMYIEAGSTGNAGTLAIETATATTLRNWKIKVSYIQCGSDWAAPTGCTQYFTGVSNTISSYNFQEGRQIDNQRMSLCLRQEEGFCSFEVSQNAATTPDPFQLRDNNGDAAIAFTAPTAVEISCANNYIQFPIASSTSDQRCGELFGLTDGSEVASAVTSSRTTPFVINYYSELTGITAGQTTGFNLDYTQVPC